MSNGLFGSSILDVAIGLFFVYWVLSLVCLTINELFARWQQMRAKELRNGIHALLGTELANKVLRQPLIKGMSHNDGLSTDPAKPATAANQLPDYIAPDVFTQALFASVAPVTDQVEVRNTSGTMAPTVRLMPVTLDRVVSELVTYLDGPCEDPASDRDGDKPGGRSGLLSRARALFWSPPTISTGPNKRAIGETLLNLIMQSQDPKTLFVTKDDIARMCKALPAPADPATDPLTQALADGKATIYDISRVVQELPPSGDPPVDDPRKKALLNLIALNQNSLQLAQAAVSTWYTEAMDRLSGRYKRRVQKWLLVIGFLLSALIGADSLRIIHTLYVDPITRAAMVAQASQAITSTAPLTSTAEQSLATVQGYNQLFGYDDVGQALHPKGKKGPDAASWVMLIVGRVAGVILTTIALILGAPFWFDVLSNIVNLRATGPPPQKST